MKRKLKSDRGFTLAELLIVVAIIGVLVAIAIPIFTGQLEKSREAVDLSDVRSAYAEVMMAAITGDTSAMYTKNSSTIYDTTHNYYQIIVSPLKQQKPGWDTPLPITIGGVSSTDTTHWQGDPGAGGSCEITYWPDSDSVTFVWSGGTSGGGGNGGTSGGDGGNSGGDGGNSGGNAGGGTDSGNNGGDNNTDNGGNNNSGESPNPGSGTISKTWPDFTIDNIIPFVIGDGNISVKTSNVYSYLGRYYVCVQDHTATDKWTDYSSIIPNGNKWPYVEIVSDPLVLTKDKLIYNGQYDTVGYFENVTQGTIYKSPSGALYIMKNDYKGWCKTPEAGNGEWLLIKS